MSRPPVHHYEIDDEELSFYRDVKKFKWQLVADFLGVPLWWLEKYIRKHNLKFETKKVSADYDERGYHNKKVNRIAREYGYKDIWDAIIDLKMKKWTHKAIAKHLGLHEVSISLYTPKDLKGMMVNSIEKQEANRKSIEKNRIKAFERIKKGKHPWQRTFKK